MDDSGSPRLGCCPRLSMFLKGSCTLGQTAQANPALSPYLRRRPPLEFSMRSLAPICSAALLCSACHSPTHPAPASSATVAAITPADLEKRLFIIAHDSMMGRETGSEGELQGRRLHRVGVSPPGAATRGRERHLLPDRALLTASPSTRRSRHHRRRNDARARARFLADRTAPSRRAASTV